MILINCANITFENRKITNHIPNYSYPACSYTGIPFPSGAVKPDLLKLVNIRKPPKQYELDELFREAGHEVIRLPPYHSELNPIELVWGFQKSYVERHRTSKTNGIYITIYCAAIMLTIFQSLLAHYYP